MSKRIWRRDSLWFRKMERQSAETWRQVLELNEGHPAPSWPKAARNIKKMLRNRRTPALFHNGGKK